MRYFLLLRYGLVEFMQGWIHSDIERGLDSTVHKECAGQSFDHTHKLDGHAH